MQLVAVLVLALVRLSAQQTNTCPAGYEAWNSACYRFNLPAQNWQGARQACKHASPQWIVDLAVFDSQAESNWVTSRIKKLSWFSTPHWYIGVYSDLVTGRMTYVNGTMLPTSKPTDVPYMSWSSSITITGETRYAAFNHFQSLWYIADGNVRRSFVCELVLKPTGNCDTANKWKLGPDNNCHKLQNLVGYGDWYDAAQQCKLQDAQLVKIADNQTNFFAYSLTPLSTTTRTTDVWIGGKSEANGSSYSWTWTDKSALTYTDWKTNTSDIIASSGDYNKRCIMWQYDRVLQPGRWRHEACEDNFFNKAQYAWCAKSPLVCIPGWIEENNMCYLMMTEKYTWDHASDVCKSIKARLLMPYVNQTLEFLRKQALVEFYDNDIDNVWVGLNQPTYNSSYVWSTYEPYNQLYWLPGENSKKLLNRGCAKMDAATKDPQWRATSCNDVGGFICEVQLGNLMANPDAPRPPTKRCEIGWTLVNDKNCMLYRPTRRTWDAARKDCKNLGGDLVKLTTYDEQEEIMDPSITDYRNTEFWIGLLRSSTTSNNYRWLDGTNAQLTFTNWDDTTPSPQISTEGTCGIAYTAYSGEQSGRWNMRSCSSSKPYMCKKVATLSAFTTTATPGVDNAIYCGGNGWMTDAYSTSCYQYHEDAPTTWSAAQLVCQSNGGNLLSISDPTERQLIQSHLQSQRGVPGIWLGLNADGNSAYYTWIDGSPAVYFNWNKGQPNSYNGACVSMSTNNGGWSVESCTNKVGFICEKPKNISAPTTKPAVTVPLRPGEAFVCKAGYTLIAGTNKCIALYQRIATHAAARQNCLADGGTLATIADKNENDNYFKLFNYNSDPAWIGLEDSIPASLEIWFKWPDGTVPRWTNWAAYEPSNSQSSNGERQDCVFMNKGDGRWSDAYCSSTMNAYFCEMPAKLGAVVTTTPPYGCPLHDESFPAAALDGYCYYFNWMESLTFYEAQDQCRRFGSGGNLVSILTQQEQTFLSVELLNRNYDFPFYIGLQGNVNSMFWQGGSKATFYNYAPEVVLTSSYVCTFMATGGPNHGLWYTNDCYRVLHYICKIPRIGWTGTTRPATTPYRDLTKCSDLHPEDPVVDGGDYCFVIRGNANYLANIHQKSFNQANSLCKSFGTGGGFLATIQSLELNDMIVELATNISFIQHSLWIGLSVGSDGQGFRWQNGEQFYYNHFAPGQPASSAASTCVSIRSDGLWYTSNCNQQRNYVCQVPKPHHAANATTLSPFTRDPNSQVCGGGDKWAFNNDTCYWFDTNSHMTWSSANDFCMKLNATLTSIHSAEEQQFLASVTQRYFASDLSWIGLNELDHIGYKWADGSLFTYNNWDLGQPNDDFGAQLCVAMRSASGKWIDQDCTRPYPFICKKWLKDAPPLPTTAPPTGNCPPNFEQFGSKCFYVDTSKLVDHVAARNECAKFASTASGKGVYLASVLSASEQAFLVSLMRGTTAPVWIGLVNKGEQSVYDYKWISEEPITYVNWGSGQPSASGQVGGAGNDGTTNDRNCIMMSNVKTQVGRWYEDSCARQLNFACSTYISPNYPAIPNKCQNGFKQSGKSCYLVSSSTNDASMWENAKSRCASSKAYLTMIMDVYDQSFLFSQVSLLKATTDMWIGLQMTPSGVANWDSNWPVLYTNWHYDQPQIDGRQCVKMSASTGTWYVEQCSKPYGFICRDVTTLDDPQPSYPSEGDIDVPGPCPNVPVGSKAVWITIGSYCYYVDTFSAKAFGDQLSACKSFGSNTEIASVTSDRTNELLVRAIQEQQSTFTNSRDPWIGYVQSGDALESIDGTPLTYVHWENGIPPDFDNTADPMCVLINGFTGFWQFEPCPSKMGVICRQPKEAQPPVIETTLPVVKTYSSTHRTHHITATLPHEDVNTADIQSDSSSTTLIILISVGAVCVIATLIAVIYMARAKPYLMPNWIVNIVGSSNAPTSLGVENEIYEPSKSSSGVEGPATSEGGTI